MPTTPFEFNVKAGSSLRGVAQQLAQAGALKQPFLFTWVGHLSGRGAAIKAGNYTLDAGITPWDLLQKLTKGQVTQTKVKFIEGWTFNQIRQELNQTSGLRHDTQALSKEEIMAKLGAPDQHPEGRFFPDTYFFSHGMSDLTILARAHKLMQAHLDAEWRARAPNLPYATPEEALIMASIVEKETGQAAERPMIAGVFVNRLRSGMLLQTDPTVIYGLGESFDGNLRRRDLLADTPYNTYTRAGKRHLGALGSIYRCYFCLSGRRPRHRAGALAGIRKLGTKRAATGPHFPFRCAAGNQPRAFVAQCVARSFRAGKTRFFRARASSLSRSRSAA